MFSRHIHISFNLSQMIPWGNVEYVRDVPTNCSMMIYNVRYPDVCNGVNWFVLFSALLCAGAVLIVILTRNGRRIQRGINLGPR